MGAAAEGGRAASELSAASTSIIACSSGFCPLAKACTRSSRGASIRQMTQERKPGCGELTKSPR